MFFSYPADRKQRVIQLLTEALTAVKSGHIDVCRDVSIGPGADGLGFTQEKGTCFFGIEFRMVAPKKAEVVTPTTFIERDTVIPSAPSSGLVEQVIRRKLTDREAETMKQHGTYTCKRCGKFTTQSPKGFKKHYNKCGGKE